jgi:hypothetical protein
MRTGNQTRGPLGSGGFTHVDEAGVEWTVSTTWHVIGGRAECTALALDSQGRGRVTSTLVRQVEVKVREQRTARASITLRLSREGGPQVRARAARQVAAYDAGETPSPGRRRDDAKWLARARAMADAWAEERPMLQALRDLEPGFQESTYRKRLDRAREWDREHGPGLLDGVGRARRREQER